MWAIAEESQEEAVPALKGREAGSPLMTFPADTWKRATPESQQIDSHHMYVALEFLKSHCNADGIDEVMLVRNGVVVFDRCTLTTNVEIGAHTHLNVGCAVQHDSTVGSFVQMSPGVLVNGDCVIGDDVFLGTGAIVTRGCTIGDGARVGAGSVVLDDVPPGAFAFGTPAQRQSTRQ